MEAALRDVGCAVVPLLGPDEVQRLRAIFDDLHPDPGRGFETDFEIDDPALKAAVRDRTAWVADACTEVLAGHEVFMTSFLVKWPTEGSELDLHADWSYVDERAERSLAAWVPLVDTGPDHENGALYVVPGSHRIVQSWRGTRTPPWYGPGRAGFLQVATPIEVPAGHLAVFDNRLLHHSVPNRGSAPRPVLALALAPRGARLVHVVGDGGERGALLPIDADFFVHHTPSGLRAVPPSTETAAESVDLVADPPGPWELAARYGVDDAGWFADAPLGAGARRWPMSVDDEGLRASCQELVHRLASGDLVFAPRSDLPLPAAGEMRELVLVEACRLTPAGADLLGSLATGAPWRSVRVVLLPPSTWAHPAFPVDGPCTVFSLDPAAPDAPVVLRGVDGWAELSPSRTTEVPSLRGLSIDARRAEPLAIVIAESLPGDPRARRRAVLADRFGPRARRRQRAIELAAAVGS